MFFFFFILFLLLLLPFQDACLRRLLEGLQIYSVLLKHVEEQYPLSRIPSEVRYYSSILIKEVENKVGGTRNVQTKAKDQMFLNWNVVSLLAQVRERDQAAPRTSGQEEQQQQVLRDLDQSDTFHKKMTAHGILYHLHYFLVDCRRVIVNKRSKPREAEAAAEAAASRVMTAVTFYHQKRKM